MCFFINSSLFFSFTYISLLAFVSGFFKICFLRSRCSMEMWCPEDIGRDSWDWVGPPAWDRARLNSPEWSGGSSPVRAEPHLDLSVCYLSVCGLSVCWLVVCGLSVCRFVGLWFVVCCLLFVVCCLLFVVCCLLFVVCCLLFVVSRLSVVVC